jgi:hypothetical protein
MRRTRRCPRRRPPRRVCRRRGRFRFGGGAELDGGGGTTTTETDWSGRLTWTRRSCSRRAVACEAAEAEIRHEAASAVVRCAGVRQRRAERGDCGRAGDGRRRSGNDDQRGAEADASGERGRRANGRRGDERRGRAAAPPHPTVDRPSQVSSVASAGASPSLIRLIKIE